MDCCAGGVAVGRLRTPAKDWIKAAHCQLVGIFSSLALKELSFTRRQQQTASTFSSLGLNTLRVFVVCCTINKRYYRLLLLLLLRLQRLIAYSLCLVRKGAAERREESL